MKEVQFEDKAKKIPFLGHLHLRSVMFVVLLVVIMVAFSFVAILQSSGYYFKQKYPLCKIPNKDIQKLGNGICNGGFLNTFQCGFDDGDCIDFNIAYPSCYAVTPERVNDGVCHDAYNNEECGYDGGDCCPERDSEQLKDGFCHAGVFNTAACLYDYGDCDDLRTKFPFCKEYDGEPITDENNLPIVIGNGICDHSKEYISQYMTAQCGWVFGDCTSIDQIGESNRAKYNDCKATDLWKIGNGICDGGDFLTEECGWEEFDCCGLDHAKIGDGDCDSDEASGDILYLTRNCGYEDYDCCNLKHLVGNGVCQDEEYSQLENSSPLECAWDGGDCDIEDYNDCNVKYPHQIGDGICHGGDYNTEVCGYDGGDCLAWNAKFPDCNIDQLDQVSNQFCQESGNFIECGWDGGDCLIVSYYVIHVFLFYSMFYTLT